MPDIEVRLGGEGNADTIWRVGLDLAKLLRELSVKGFRNKWPPVAMLTFIMRLFPAMLNVWRACWRPVRSVVGWLEGKRVRRFGLPGQEKKAAQQGMLAAHPNESSPVQMSPFVSLETVAAS